MDNILPSSPCDCRLCVSAQWLSPNSWLVALVAATVSGVAVAITMTPFDVISTRLYNQPVDESHRVLLSFPPLNQTSPAAATVEPQHESNLPPFQGRLYHGFSDCMLKVCQAEGMLGLYKGMGPVFVRLAPHTVLSMLFWDLMRQQAVKSDGKKRKAPAADAV